MVLERTSRNQGSGLLGVKTLDPAIASLLGAVPERPQCQQVGHRMMQRQRPSGSGIHIIVIIIMLWKAGGGGGAGVDISYASWYTPPGGGG